MQQVHMEMQMKEDPPVTDVDASTGSAMLIEVYPLRHVHP